MEHAGETSTSLRLCYSLIKMMVIEKGSHAGEDTLFVSSVARCVTPVLVGVQSVEGVSSHFRRQSV